VKSVVIDDGKERDAFVWFLCLVVYIWWPIDAYLFNSRLSYAIWVIGVSDI